MADWRLLLLLHGSAQLRACRLVQGLELLPETPADEAARVLAHYRRWTFTRDDETGRSRRTPIYLRLRAWGPGVLSLEVTP